MQCIAGSPVSYSVPSAVIYAGVLIVPPVGASGTLKMSFSAVTTSYFFIDPAGPTFINFDPANQPSVIYLNASVNENVMLQFI